MRDPCQGSWALLRGAPHPRQVPGTAMVGRGGHCHGVQWWLWGAQGGSEVAAGLALGGQPIEGARPRPVALVQPPHTVTLVVDVVGDVLQVLQV